MAPRLNKRQLREQEELANLEAAKQTGEKIDVEESEEEIAQQVKSAGGGFAAVSQYAYHSRIHSLYTAYECRGIRHRERYNVDASGVQVQEGS